jgi:hypothetical protein
VVTTSSPESAETPRPVDSAPAAAAAPTSAYTPVPAPPQEAPAGASSIAAQVTGGTAPFAPAGGTGDGSVTPAACASCGAVHANVPGYVNGGASFCGPGGCHAGHPPCEYGPEPCTFIGRFFRNIYECLCCPDPCYQPQWVPAANASFFTDYARPRTVTRLRFDRGLDMTLPDRNEYFYKFKGTTPPGFGSKSGNPFVVNGTRYRADPSLNFNQLYLYQEAAAARGSFFFEIPYRQISPLYSPSAAGFSDIRLGTKALLFDCELMQLTFQFKTYLPSGNAMAGLGTGHVSLEPSFLLALRLAQDTYFQAQLAQWIPLGGTPNIAGGVLSYNFALNQVLVWCTPNSPLIGTLEMNASTFQNGGATNPVVTAIGPGRVGSGGITYFSIGPGLRQSICNNLDFGGAFLWATTDNHWANPLFRFEVRFLY